MKEILGLELEELKHILPGPAYRANQVFEWLYAKLETDFHNMTNLPANYREELAREFQITMPAEAGVQHSKDGTAKYALQFGADVVEAVYMPEERRDTICLSSQVGCSFGCKFCVTARMNLRRQLSAGEILAQVMLVVKQHGREKKLNLVFMGMGEPLHNYDNVLKAFRILSHPRGLAISSRNITISTVGVVPSLERLKDEPTMPNLAVSLNAPTNELRNELMPINRLYPIEKLMQTLNQLPLKYRQKITFEYVLLKGVNDSQLHAKQLLEATRSVRCKINLIPFNPDPHLEFERPDEASISTFARVLSQGGRTVSVRRSRGPEISAACGQLGTQYINPALIPLGLSR